MVAPIIDAIIVVMKEKDFHGPATNVDLISVSIASLTKKLYQLKIHNIIGWNQMLNNCKDF